jgi:hypothetical protein
MSWFEQGMFLARYPMCGWYCGLFGKVLRVRCGIVVRLERYLVTLKHGACRDCRPQQQASGVAAY